MTKIVGILNITSDSFSGDGVNEPDTIESRILQMIKDGAGVIDIGAESTRPKAILLSPEDEWERLDKVLDIVRRNIDKVSFSIDTRHAITAKRFIDNMTRKNACHVFINDVSGGVDSGIINIAQEYDARLVLTHSLTVPADPEVTIHEEDSASDIVYKWATGIIGRLGDKIIIDPGIGFGKTAKQSIDIIKNIGKLKSLGAEVMVGHSRKSFLSLFSDKVASERDPESLLISNFLVGQCVDYLRVHDVKSHTAMLRIREVL